MLDISMQPAIDIQKEPDQRGIALLDVGIAEVAYPILVPGPAWRGWQPTNGEFALSVDLPAEQKGTHMSRFMEMLADHDGAISPRTLPLLLAGLQRRLGSSMARIEVEFKYFLERGSGLGQAGQDAGLGQAGQDALRLRAGWRGHGPTRPANPAGHGGCRHALSLLQGDQCARGAR